MDIEEKKRKAYRTRRAIMDYGMGILYAAMGIVVLMAGKIWGSDKEILPAPYSYFFAGICLLYGGFRIYRGFKKNYFNE